MMRGGTSSGPYFHANDLPEDRPTMEAVLLRLMGSPDPRQIDGIGGATTVTSKVAIVSRSDHPDADIDYLFAQVDIENCRVDWEPTCGNMLSGVGPFAIEERLLGAEPGVTELVVRNVNTESLIDVTVQTPGGRLTYEGDCVIAGVPGAGAPIGLRFREIMGSQTTSLLPTGNCIDNFAGVEATCIDVAMPMVIVRAHDMGLEGDEQPSELTRNSAFMGRLHTIRQLAGRAMGLGDVAGRVVPKFAVVSAPKAEGHFASRYFTPSHCHPAYAVSGSIAAASCALLPGSIGHQVARSDNRLPNLVQIEHPSGSMDVQLEVKLKAGHLSVLSGGIVRTARRLTAGVVYVPTSIWLDET